MEVDPGLITQIATVGAALVGTPAGGLILRKLYRIVTNHIKRVELLLAKIDHLEQLANELKATVGGLALRVTTVETSLNRMAAEFQSNGGKSFRDVIGSIRAEVQVLSSRLAWRLTDKGNAGYECDAFGACIKADPALAKLFGLEPDEMLGSGWLAGIPEQAERERVYHEWSSSVENQIPYTAEYYVGPRSGPWTKIWTTVIAVRRDSKPDGEILRYIGIVQRDPTAPLKYPRRPPGKKAPDPIPEPTEEPHPLND